MDEATIKALDELNEVIRVVVDIAKKLFSGRIKFRYDNMMCAMKPGHPGEILEEILSEIYWDVIAGRVPPVEKVRNVRDNLIAFKKDFQVRGLKKAIDILNAYTGERIEE